MPRYVHFDAETDAIVCEACGNRYDPAIEGLVQAIECCHTMDRVQRDTIPICDFNLKLSRDEIAESEWSLTQLLFIQAIYDAQQLRYDPLEYDILSDSMVRLQEYVGIDIDAIQDLIDADLVRHDGDHPLACTPSLRTVGRPSASPTATASTTATGKGISKSHEHVFMVQIGILFLEQHYRDDPESDVVTVKPYHDLAKGELAASAFFEGDNTDRESTTAFEQRRLDVALVSAVRPRY